MKLISISVMYGAVAACSLFSFFPFFAITSGRIDVIAESLKTWAMLVGVLGAPSAVLASLLSVGAYYLNRPTVRVHDGRVTVVNCGEPVAVELSKIEWYLGRVSDMDMLKTARVLSDEAVILVLPEPDGRKVAVGIADEGRKLWCAFLTLTKTKQRLDLQTQVRVPNMLKGALLLVGLSFVGAIVVRICSLGAN